MLVSFIHDRPTWDTLAEPWNGLLAHSATDVPFLRFEFLQSWWATLGGGEWPDGELAVAVGRSEDGGLAAALPLFRTSVRPGALLVIGTAEIADYLDVVGPPSQLEPFVRSLLQAIARGEPAGIETLDVWNVLEASPGSRALAAIGIEMGWSVERTRLKPCPLVDLDGGWDAYLMRLEKKQRHELRRKMRRAQQTAGARFVRAGQGLDLAEATEAFLRLMVFDAAKARFLTPSMHAMFQALVRSAAQAGWLRLEFLMVGDRPAAAAFCFDYGGRLLIYNSGMDPAYRELSPGWALVGHLIQAAAEEGKTAVDFMRGEEDYKIRLGGEPRYVERITLRRP
jgi:CelD/BcsL family acetyltransferase involved in cellulose biosynthesis